MECVYSGMSQTQHMVYLSTQPKPSDLFMTSLQENHSSTNYLIYIDVSFTQHHHSSDRALLTTSYFFTIDSATILSLAISAVSSRPIHVGGL